MEEKLFEFENQKFKVEVISSKGIASALGFYYDQDMSEFVMITQGSATLEIEGQLINLNKGDHLLIKKHQKHRVNKTSKDCIWYCLFLKN